MPFPEIGADVITLVIGILSFLFSLIVVGKFRKKPKVVTERSLAPSVNGVVAAGVEAVVEEAERESEAVMEAIVEKDNPGSALADILNNRRRKR